MGKLFFTNFLRIVKLSKYLNDTHHIYRLSDQILRSGTSVGANIREAEYGQSKADFIHKLSISLKEANETEYWLCLLKDSGYLDEKMFQSLELDIKELIKMLISSINTTKKNNRTNN